MLFVLRNAGMNAAIEDSFSQLLAWTLTNKFQSTGAEDYILKQKVLSLLEWVCVTYMFRMSFCCMTAYELQEGRQTSHSSLSVSRRQGDGLQTMLQK